MAAAEEPSGIERFFVELHKIDGVLELRRVDHLVANAPSLEDALRASLAASAAKPRDEGSDDDA